MESLQVSQSFGQEVFLRKDEEYTSMAQELIPSLEVNPRLQFFKHKIIDFPRPWKKHPSSDICKVKAGNEDSGVFAKIFPPRYGDYPETAFNAMNELAERMPILRPQGLYMPDDVDRGQCGGIIFFPLGTNSETLPLDALPDNHRRAIDHVARQYKLTPIENKLTVVTVDGVRKVIDPWEDRDDVILKDLKRQSMQ
jgi:hypothetical protein